MKKHIFIAVTNDLSTDQRVNRIARTLSENGYTVKLIGSYLRKSYPLKMDFDNKRFNLVFKSGALFYAEYNIRLFLFLLFNRFDIILANDLDTLLGAYLGALLKRKPIVFDSHELFIEVPELVNRPLQKNSWKLLDRLLIPRLKYCYTVCDSIARYYHKKYGSHFTVIRNVPGNIRNYHTSSNCWWTN